MAFLEEKGLGRGKGRWREAEAETGTGEGGGGALAVVKTGGRRGAQRGYRDMAGGVRTQVVTMLILPFGLSASHKCDSGMTRCVRVCGGNRRIAGQTEIANQLVGDLELEVWALGLRNPWRCSFDSARPSYFYCAGQVTFSII
uniref:Uncharacterized protein n=1 Tax=Oryza barthii TaxID=65489 RepID=A0A0D3EZE3_9ORYZ